MPLKQVYGRLTHHTRAHKTASSFKTFLKASAVFGALMAGSTPLSAQTINCSDSTVTAPAILLTPATQATHNEAGCTAGAAGVAASIGIDAVDNIIDKGLKTQGQGQGNSGGFAQPSTVGRMGKYNGSGNMGSASEPFYFFMESTITDKEHDGFSNFTNATGSKGLTQGLDGVETSVLGGLLFNTPKDDNGGFWQLGGLLGYSYFDFDLKNTINGNGDQNKFLAGAVANYRIGSSYFNVTGVIMPGELQVGNNAKHDTLGFLATTKLGTIFDVMPENGIKGDLRGDLTYTSENGDRFIAQNGTAIENDMNKLEGKLSLTLYQNVQISSKEFLKPYVKGTLINDFVFDKELTIGTTTQELDQKSFSGMGEIGLGYFDGRDFYSAAMFAGGASDRFDWGGKLRLNIKLN